MANSTLRIVEQLQQQTEGHFREWDSAELVSILEGEGIRDDPGAGVVKGRLRRHFKEVFGVESLAAVPAPPHGESSSHSSSGLLSPRPAPDSPLSDADTDADASDVERGETAHSSRHSARVDDDPSSVALLAWGEHTSLRFHADKQQRLGIGLQYGLIGVNLTAALFAVGKIAHDQQNALQHMRTDGLGGWRLGMVLLPLVSALILTLLKGFNPHIKAAGLEYSAAAIKSEIYRWRTRTGEYARLWGEDELRTRKRFQSQVSHLSAGIGNAEMSQRGGVTSGYARLERRRRQEQGGASAGGYDRVDEDGMPVDDGVSPLETDTSDGEAEPAGDLYVSFRLEDMLKTYASSIPELELQMQSCQLAVACLTALTVLLAAMDVALWLPLTILLTTSVAAVQDVLQLQPTLLCRNHAVTALKDLQCWWVALSHEERREHCNLEVLVEGVEAAGLAGLGTPYVTKKVGTWRAENERVRREQDDEKEATRQSFKEREVETGNLKQKISKLERERKGLKRRALEAEALVEKQQRELRELKRKQDSVDERAQTAQSKKGAELKWRDLSQEQQDACRTLGWATDAACAHTAAPFRSPLLTRSCRRVAQLGQPRRQLVRSPGLVGPAILCAAGTPLRPSIAPVRRMPSLRLSGFAAAARCEHTAAVQSGL